MAAGSLPPTSAPCRPSSALTSTHIGTSAEPVQSAVGGSAAASSGVTSQGVNRPTTHATTRVRTAARSCSGIAMPATRMTARASSSTRSGGSASYRASQADATAGFPARNVVCSRPAPAISRPHCPPWPVRPVFALRPAAGPLCQTAQTPKNPLQPERWQRVLTFCAAVRDPTRTPAASHFASQVRCNMRRTPRPSPRPLLACACGRRRYVRRAAHSGRAERRTRGCHCGRQDRTVTAVGFRSVPVGESGGGVFEGGLRWRESAEGGAGGMRLAMKTQRGAGP